MTQLYICIIVPILNYTATMAIEDMYLSKEFMKKVIKVETGQRTSSDLRQEIIQKYGR